MCNIHVYLTARSSGFQYTHRHTHTIRHKVVPLQLPAVVFALVELFQRGYYVLQLGREAHRDLLTRSRPGATIQDLYIDIWECIEDIPGLVQKCLLPCSDHYFVVKK